MKQMDAVNAEQGGGAAASANRLGFAGKLLGASSGCSDCAATPGSVQLAEQQQSKSTCAPSEPSSFGHGSANSQDHVRPNERLAIEGLAKLQGMSAEERASFEARRMAGAGVAVAMLPSKSKTRIKPLHRQVALLAAQGQSVSRIAEILQHSPGAVRRVLKRPEVVEFVDNLLGDAELHMVNMTPLAVQTLYDAMKSGDMKARLRAAELHFRATGRLRDTQGEKAGNGAEDVIKRALELAQASVRVVSARTEESTNAPARRFGPVIPGSFSEVA